MTTAEAMSRSESDFRKQVQRSPTPRNAYLRVYSPKLGVDLGIAEGRTGDTVADIRQPVHLASVGKLFTATIVGILNERGALSFSDPVSRYLDAELMSGLHVLDGSDHSNEIQVRHLLNQTSGLDDAFWPLMQELQRDPSMRMSPREAVEWGKRNLSPNSKPGEKHHYTDTNYYLLGLIVEAITGRPFHEALHEFIFEPLGMQSAYMQGYSEPAAPDGYPPAQIFLEDTDYTDIPGFAEIDYAGGGVRATLEDYLKFMTALVNGNLVTAETLETMKSDDAPSMPGIRYGYAIWKFVTVPVLAPAKFNCWGCVGVTGAFMFYHPLTDSYLIGSFNDTRYKSRALRFMLSKVVRPLLKCTQRS